VGRLGGQSSIFQWSWPSLRRGEAREPSRSSRFQVNGRSGGTSWSQVPAFPKAEGKSELARKSSRVKSYLDGKDCKKNHFVPGRILNLVVGRIRLVWHYVRGFPYIDNLDFQFVTPEAS